MRNLDSSFWSTLLSKCYLDIDLDLKGCLGLNQKIFLIDIDLVNIEKWETKNSETNLFILYVDNLDLR